MNALMIQQRVSALLARFGESFTLSRGGTNRQLRGVFTPLDPTTRQLYFDDNEAVSLVRPALVLTLDGTLAGTDPPAVDDTLVRDGRTFTALRVAIGRLSDTPVAVIVILD